MLGDKIGLIGRHSYQVNKDIAIYIPTVREIRGNSDEDENYYFDLVSPFLLTSTDCMVILYDIGINFENISDWQLFLMMATSKYKSKDLYLLFGKHIIANFEIRRMSADVSDDMNTLVLYDKDSNIRIDRSTFEKMSSILCQIHNVKKEHRNFGGNKDTLEYVVKREKAKIERHKNDAKNTSRFDNLILSLVCNADFPYNFETINDITIYDFNRSIAQVIKNQQVKNYNIGIWTGNVDTKKSNISPKDLNIFEAG